MNLGNLIVDLIGLGVVLYIINLIPMDAVVKKIINIVVILSICLWVVESSGVLSHLRLR